MLTPSGSHFPIAPRLRGSNFKQITHADSLWLSFSQFKRRTPSGRTDGARKAPRRLLALMIPGKATVKRKTPEAASMSRWGQTHRWGAKSNKSMLHEWHQVTQFSISLQFLRMVYGERARIPDTAHDAAGLRTDTSRMP